MASDADYVVRLADRRGMVAWGQKTEISLVLSENHDKVHSEVKTIYVDPDKPRKLSLPELNINTDLVVMSLITGLFIGM